MQSKQELENEIKRWREEAAWLRVQGSERQAQFSEAQARTLENDLKLKSQWQE